VSFITVRFDGNGVPEVLRAAKREVKIRMKEGMLKAAQDVVLPRVREVSPTIVREALTVKGAVRGPKITTQGPRKYDRIAGLLNFGGTVHQMIAPVSADGHQELYLGHGLWRARVRGARHYTGKHFIEAGIELAFPAFQDVVLSTVLESFGGLA
jgi:hypothetical protein